MLGQQGITLPSLSSILPLYRKYKITKKYSQRQRSNETTRVACLSLYLYSLVSALSLPTLPLGSSPSLFFLEVSVVFPQWLSTETPRPRRWSEKSGRTRCSWPHLPHRSLLSDRSPIRQKRSSLRLLCSLRRNSSVSPLRPCRPMGPSWASSRMPSPKCKTVCGVSLILRNLFYGFFFFFIPYKRKEKKRKENEVLVWEREREKWKEKRKILIECMRMLMCLMGSKFGFCFIFSYFLGKQTQDLCNFLQVFLWLLNCLQFRFASIENESFVMKDLRLRVFT